MKFVLRRAVAEDAEGIARVQVATWLDAYRGIVADETLDAVTLQERIDRWRSLLTPASQSSLTFVADVHGEVVGFASGGKSRRSEFHYDAELYALYVHPSSQRHGVGRCLMQAVVDSLEAQGFKSLLVGVFEANRSGRRFYEAMGGRHIGQQPLEWGGHLYPETFYGWAALKDVSAEK